MAHIHNFSSFPDNVVQNVQTYQLTQIAWLLLENFLIKNSNRHFDNLPSFKGQLGSTVTFNREPQAIFTNGTIVPQLQPIIQNKLSLSIDQQGNSSFDLPPLDQYFNIDPTNWMPNVETSALKEMGTAVEVFLGNAMQGCFRFYGDGVTPINSAQQLAEIVEYFEEFGASNIDMKAVLPSYIYPQFAATMLQEFALKRNDELAHYSWYKGEYNDCSWGKSKLLPTHVAGTAGAGAIPLTVVSTNDPTGQNITQITFSGSIGTDPNCIKKNDKLVFVDGVGSFTNLRYLSYHGHFPLVKNKVTMCAASDAASTSGTVTVTLTHPLCSVSGLAQNNINAAIEAGMQVNVMPSHKVGLIMSGNPLYLAMPAANTWIDASPFAQSSVIDEETGISVTLYQGWDINRATRITSMPIIYGAQIEPLNAMVILIPLTQ